MRHLWILASVVFLLINPSSHAAAADDPLRAAIEDLTATFKDHYPHGREYLARLDRIDEQLKTAAGPQAEQLRAEREALRREALVANPLVSSRPIVFMVRHQYKPDHHNTETMFQTGEINPDLPIELDTERFESLLREASLCSEDGENRLRLRLKALELYKGDFLPDAAADIWAMSINTYFHFRYMSAVNEVLEALVGRGNFDEVVGLAEKAIAIDPYAESLYYNLILALMNTNRMQAAREQYERMKRLFYGEFGIAPSKELQALYKKLVKSEKGVEKDMKVVSAELCQSKADSGAFFCEYEIFEDVFRKEFSAARRDGKPIHICLINADGKEGEALSPQKQDTVMRRLCSCIKKNLREGDIFSRYSVSQFILLLPLASYKDSEKVLERVIKKYRHDNPHSPAAVSCSLQTIEPS